ncbi:hypothetical protein [Streptomyces hesseae]|uniref:DUF8017 domain-containing protein n=1 Tax=Streptomyces hesseae TaxID=3075519 RepID=A0ABU2STB1_9ACTN|nr:hypothetical protein [Streptomyces sp. DSM 40473]MDT0451065.1 hypothetical protein [Streptomyces sp. DSM 40473]
MWPGQQQPGGEQNPQDPDRNPYAQPVPGQPQGGNPYQQPGYQQPNPYAQQPAGAPPVPPPGAPQWSPPGAPGGPQPQGGGGGRDKRTTVIAISVAAAVVVAAGITGFLVLKDDGGKDDPSPAAKDTKPSASAQAPSPAASSQAPLDNPRVGGDIKPVVGGWKVVVNSKRHLAFDVPTDWEVPPDGTALRIPDEADTSGMKLAEAASSPAYFQREQCSVKNDRGTDDTYSSGVSGTKGAQGAKGPEEAAQNEASAWAWAMFDQKKQGKYDIGKATPFKNDYGITGATATTTVTGVPKANKCSSDGKAVAVAFKDANGDFAVWFFSGAKGTKGEVADDTLKKVMTTLRPLPSS